VRKCWQSPNKAVKSDAIFARYAHYKRAAYGGRYAYRSLSSDTEVAR
jgi:hypothetical protein